MDTTFLQTTDMSSWARGIANLGGANVQQQGAMDSWMERPSSAHGGAYAVAGILGACAIAACARGRLAELEKQDERRRKRREVSGATEQSSALEKAWLEAKTKQSTRNFQAKDGHLSAKVSNRTRPPQPPTCLGCPVHTPGSRAHHGPRKLRQVPRHLRHRRRRRRQFEDVSSKLVLDVCQQGLDSYPAGGEVLLQDALLVHVATEAAA